MEFQKTFEDNVKSVYKNGEKWLANLPRILAELSKQWNFRLIKELPDLSYSFVALVEVLETKQNAIFKIAPIQNSLEKEAQWLKAYKNIVPQIYAFHLEHNAVLMEHLNPGSSLKDLVIANQDDKATEIFCEVIKNLQMQKPKDLNFPHISTLAISFASLKNQIDEKLRSKAVSLFKDLSNENPDDILLHGDLHHANILSSGNAWKIIDPKGYRGPALAEVAAMIRNPYDAFPDMTSPSKVFRRRIDIMDEHLSFDRDLMIAWCFCITVLSAAWTFEGYGKVTDSEKAFCSALSDMLT